MDIQGKTVLILGGWGLVGSAICRKFMEENPRRMVIASLRKEEALEAVAALRKEYPKAGSDFFVPWWGNIFAREALKELSREQILGDEKRRRMFIADILDELNEPLLERSSLYRLLQKYRPEIVVDAINSATAIAYQDLSRSHVPFSSSWRQRGRPQIRTHRWESTTWLQPPSASSAHSTSRNSSATPSSYTGR